MVNADDLQEFAPGHVFHDNDLTTQYWIDDQGMTIWRQTPIRSARAASFRFYLGGFAKDEKNCYCYGGRLVGAEPKTFRALNYTYFTDGRLVWTIGGKLPDVDAETFVVCDSGSYTDTVPGTTTRVPYGYGKDAQRVYYYDFDGKPNLVRKATAKTFISLGDGHFGKDENFVFCGNATIAKAKVAHWRRIGGNYSKDDSRIFYFNRIMNGADFESFRVVPSQSKMPYLNFARDKNHFYWNDRVVDDDKSAAKFWMENAQPDVPGDVPPMVRP
jgi:DKNYY family